MNVNVEVEHSIFMIHHFHPKVWFYLNEQTNKSAPITQSQEKFFVADNNLRLLILLAFSQIPALEKKR